MSTHKLSGTPEHRIWKGIISRCCNPNRENYCDYGGSGVIVCERWRHDFAAFLADMGPRPTPKHQIDRFPNKNGNYEPGNCRWATPREQATNRKSNIVLEYGGKRQTATEWEREMGYPPFLIIQRIRKLGWSSERAIMTPPQVQKGRSSDDVVRRFSKTG